MSPAEAGLLLLLVSGGFEPHVEGTGPQAHARALAEADGWIRAHPGDPDVPKARVWMGELLLLDGASDRARPLLEQGRDEAAQRHDEPTHAHAVKLLADLALASGDYAEARDGYATLRSAALPLWRYVGEEGERAAAAALWRYRIAAAIALLLVLALVTRGVRARRELWPPPEMVIGAAPALTLIALSAFAVHHRRSVFAFVAAALAVLWIEGAGASVRRPPVWRTAAAIAGQIALFGLTIVTLGHFESWLGFVFAAPD